jgi:hypothetical protein
VVPGDAVVDVAPGWWPVAAGEDAAAVPEGDGPADGDGPLPGGAADVEDLAAFVEDGAEHGGVAAGEREVGGVGVGPDEDADAVAIGDGRVGGRSPVVLGDEVGEGVGPQRRGQEPFE